MIDLLDFDMHAAAILFGVVLFMCWVFLTA